MLLEITHKWVVQSGLLTLITQRKALTEIKWNKIMMSNNWIK